jgi:multiple sugar transport system ATP-binding protein
MARIDITDLTKRFESEQGTITAVEELNLTVEDGEFIVLVGPSGCGKTTTLRCVAGLEDVSEGSITFDDRDVTGVRARDRVLRWYFRITRSIHT